MKTSSRKICASSEGEAIESLFGRKTEGDDNICCPSVVDRHYCPNSEDNIIRIMIGGHNSTYKVTGSIWNVVKLQHVHIK